MQNPELSIIIVSYNTEKITIDCIDSVFKSLKNSSLKCEIIVIDNASTDTSVKMLKKLELKNKNLTLIENKENVGFGNANNQGIKQAKGSLLLLLNSDIVVLNQAIEKLVTYFKSQTTFKFLGGKLLNKDGTGQPSCGPFYTLPVIFAALFLKGDYWGLTRYSPGKITNVDWISGACILTEKSIFQKLGGFDKKIFMYMEEVDLFYRASKAGNLIGFYPDAKFIHLGSASSGQRTYPIIQVYNGFLYFYKKHHSKSALILLKFLLQLKALVSIGIGKILKDDYLVKTYEKAFQVASMD